MDIPYAFHKNLVLRSPRFPFVAAMPIGIIKQLLQNNAFLEAIYLASPVLYAECIKMKEGKIESAKDIAKIETSLIKYYQRMCSRCTPFGMFSGCSVAQWHDAETNVLYNENIQRSTRLDMHFLCALAQELALRPVIKNRLQHFPNTSIYKIGNEIRYIEYKYVKGKREHQITSVMHSQYVMLILENAKAGVTIEQMIQLLVSNASVSQDEAIAFIDEIIESQLLVNELEPAITGKEFLYQIVETLQRINGDKNEEISGVIEILETIEKSIKRIDASGNNEVSIYKDLIKKIQQLNVPFEENKLFQTDLFRKPQANAISSQAQQDLLKAFAFLNGLNSYNKNDNLISFAKKFTERYEGKEMPLLQLLDVENGIGYGNNTGKDISPLLENLVLPNRANADEYAIQWNKTQSWLFKKLLHAFKNNEVEVQITEEDIKMFSSHWDDLPPSVSVLFSLHDDKIVLESISGSSAANLLGRFAHGNDEINTLVNDIANQEDVLNNDILFAEIIHLPQSRVGNILLHPAFRKYEIPFLAKSSLPLQQQISTNDLYVSVTGEYIKLFSKNFGKEIIPRLSTAHNFSHKSLPVYHFLSNLQAQQLRNSFSFNWGGMARQFSFLPRVVLGNVILFEATWQLSKNDFEIICKDSSTFLPMFILKWKLPRYAVLADGDNELLVDFENKISVQAFIAAIKNRDAIVLKEFIFSTKAVVKNETGGLFVNQFIAPLIKTEKVYGSSQLNTATPKIAVPQNFLPGSEWVYFKLYCGVKSADKILLELVHPLVLQLLHEKKISKWFFIRYNDPNFHLRIRFQVLNKKDASSIINIFSQAMKNAEAENLVWKMQIDTYQRELERYGHQAIDAAETLFFKDSMQKLFFLGSIQGDERENARWLFGIKTIDELLNAFNYSLQDKHALLKKIKDAFAKEFYADKNTFQQLNKKYALHKADIKNMISNTFPEKPYWDAFNTLWGDEQYNFKITAEQISTLINPAKINDAMASYIHMSLNRLFLSDARLQEMIVYDFMFTYYHSEMMRKANILSK
jgi:thiopeptide-type bacteriocin biosynthesis protein